MKFVEEEEEKGFRDGSLQIIALAIILDSSMAFFLVRL